MGRSRSLLSKIKSHRWTLGLAAVTVVAIAVRSLPALLNQGWGSDFGIYYGIAEQVIASEEVFVPYDGWGASYNYFPVLYLIVGALYSVTNIGVIELLAQSVPVFGGLTVVILYYIVTSLTGNRAVGLLAAAFLAVTSVHAYQTSHAYPLTIGHFFFLLSMLFFIRYQKNRAYILPLTVATIFLICSHHLTSYFYIVSIFSIIFFQELTGTDRPRRLFRNSCYMAFVLTATFAYWAYVATPVMGFVGSGLPFDARTTMALSYVVFLLLPVIASFIHKKYRVRFARSRPSMKENVILLGIVFGLVSVALIVFAVAGVPRTDINLSLATVLYSLPFIAVTAFFLVGFRYMGLEDNGSVVRGWTVGILVSFVYSFLSWNTTLYPDRHLEYLAVPLCVLAAVGVLKFFDGLSFSGGIWRPVAHLVTKKRAVVVGVVAVLCLTNAVSIYPSQASLKLYDESIPRCCFTAMGWAREHLPANATVASDHRLSQVAWAYGFNITDDKTDELWSATNWTACVGDLQGEKENYTRIAYVVVDDIMYDVGVQLKAWNPPANLTAASYAKFREKPFARVYNTSMVNRAGETTHWVEIYRVNWTYIEQHGFSEPSP